MTRTKLGLLGLCAVVVGMMAMSASATQGATLSWLILNKAKTEATNLKAELATSADSAHMTLDGEVANLKIAVSCTGIALKGAFLEPVEKLTEGFKFVLTGCKVFQSPPLTTEYNCTVKSSGAATGTIESGELKGLLELIGSDVLLRIEPKTGPTGVFKTLRFEGPECVLPELNQLHGTLYLKDCEGFPTIHTLEHLFVSSEPTRLYIGGHSLKQLEVTKFLGSFYIKLAGAHAGLSWAAMDV
jgi:hypothetical protein